MYVAGLHVPADAPLTSVDTAPVLRFTRTTIHVDVEGTMVAAGEAAPRVAVAVGEPANCRWWSAGGGEPARRLVEDAVDEDELVGLALGLTAISASSPPAAAPPPTKYSSSSARGSRTPSAKSSRRRTKAVAEEEDVKVAVALADSVALADAVDDEVELPPPPPPPPPPADVLVCVAEAEAEDDAVDVDDCEERPPDVPVAVAVADVVAVDECVKPVDSVAVAVADAEVVEDDVKPVVSVADEVQLDESVADADPKPPAPPPPAPVLEAEEVGDAALLAPALFVDVGDAKAVGCTVGESVAALGTLKPSTYTCVVEAARPAT